MARETVECVLDVDRLVARRGIGLAWHRERQPSPAARAFMELARSVCGPPGAASAA
jgi:DNA-binding transcriptional LysR family regulator